MSDDQPDPKALAARLDAVWERRMPAVIARIDAIESAADPGADPGHLPEARTEAHKLRGLLGTLGVGEGSEIAGLIEADLEAIIDDDGREEERRERIAVRCGELRRVVGARRPGSEDG